MFVPHEPNFCFDVYRSADRCVCGRSAIVTGDNGYCNHCDSKRTVFVDNIVGSIKNGSPYFELMENIRDNIIREKLYYMIDLYFGDEMVKTDPYGDVEFYLKCLNEKILSTEKFIEILENTTSFDINDKKKLKKNLKSNFEIMHLKYISELMRMKEADLNINRDISYSENTYQFVKTTR